MRKYVLALIAFAFAAPAFAADAPADQAAKFWPMYQQFQNEQDAIIDEQGKAVLALADRFATLTNADSLAKLQTILPGGRAARAIQIDRRLGQIGQVLLSSQLPLLH